MDMEKALHATDKNMVVIIYPYHKASTSVYWKAAAGVIIFQLSRFFPINMVQGYHQKRPNCTQNPHRLFWFEKVVAIQITSFAANCLNQSLNDFTVTKAQAVQLMFRRFELMYSFQLDIWISFDSNTVS